MNSRNWSVVAGMVVLAACSSGGVRRAGGARGTSAASSSQRAGSAATGGMSMATGRGASSDGVTCDSATEGVAWCESESLVVFCTGGSWYALDCSAIDSSAFCGYDEASNQVDCFIDDGSAGAAEGLSSEGI